MVNRFGYSHYNKTVKAFRKINGHRYVFHNDYRTKAEAEKVKRLYEGSNYVSIYKSKSPIRKNKYLLYIGPQK